MFFIQSDITIETHWRHLYEIAEVVSKALNIPKMVPDQSGKYEDLEVFEATCFGLVFAIAKIDEDPIGSFQLSIHSDTDAFDYDGSEKEVDGTQYVLLLLKRAGIKAYARKD